MNATETTLSPPAQAQLSSPACNLLDALASLLPRFVVLPKHAAETLALWIVHTWCFQFRDVSTYIGVESPEKRCGKTTLLGVLSKLVQRRLNRRRHLLSFSLDGSTDSFARTDQTDVGLSRALHAGLSFFGHPNAAPPDPPCGEVCPVARPDGAGSVSMFHAVHLDD